MRPELPTLDETREAVTLPPSSDPSFDSWQELYAIFGQLAPVERRVVVQIAQRLLAGQSSYGKLGRHGDTRKMLAEALAEALDLAVYLAVETERT